GNPVCTSVCRLAKFTAGAAAAPLHTPLMIGWMAASWASAFLPNAAVEGEASSAVFSATSWVCTRFNCGHATAAICAGWMACTLPVVVQPATHAKASIARIARMERFMGNLLRVALVKIVVRRWPRQRNRHRRAFGLFVRAVRTAEVVADDVRELADQRAQRNVDEVLVHLRQRHD